MRISDSIRCRDFPCQDVNRQCHFIPSIELDPEKIALILISESVPENRADAYYVGGESLFERTTLLAFQDAGAPVETFQDICNLGVYLTTAVKCAKTAYGIKASTIEHCSKILEQELRLFPNFKAILLMGDVAIKSVNDISRKAGQGRTIPAGSTYKIREGEFYFQGKRAFPSYLQAGPSFFIEKSKRKMIGEDIAAALKLI